MAALSASSRKASTLSIRVQPVQEQEKLTFAKWVLLGVAVLLVLGGAAYIANERGQKIFEFCITTLPPVATLVIGYYFSQRKT